MKYGFYRALASALVAMRNCQKDAEPGRTNAAHYASMANEWAEYIDWIVGEHAPSGSGFDNGTMLETDLSDSFVLVFNTSFHHMGEHGYTGWTDHRVRVRASLIGLDITVSGRNQNDIKDHLAEVFSALGDIEPGTLADYRNYQAARAQRGAEFASVSVTGGWQTQNKKTGQLIGPIFPAASDLWAWQAKNLSRE